MIDKTKKVTMFTIGLAITCLCGEAMAQSETEDIEQEQDQRISIAVYDFTTAEVYKDYYQQQRIASPINLKSDPILKPKDISVLPEEDRLELKRYEIMERIRKQQAAEAIRLKRYNDDMESRKKIRDAMLGTDLGRVILEGTQILEGDLNHYSDIFEVYSRKQGQEAFQQEANLQSSSDQNTLLSKAFQAPQYVVEGRISDITTEDNEILTEGSSIRTRTTTMNATITMMDLVTRQIVSSKTAYKASEVQRVLGRNFADEQSVYRSLLEKICAEAAADLYKVFMTTVTINVQAPQSARDLDMGYTDLYIEGEPQNIKFIDDGKYEVTLKKGKTYSITAENDDYIAKIDASFTAPKTLRMRLDYRYVTLKLKYIVSGDFDCNNASVSLINVQNADNYEESLGYGEGPFEEIEQGQYDIIVNADGYQTFKNRVSWRKGRQESITVRLVPAVSSTEKDVL